LSLAYAPPYDWEAMLGFLAARAVVGMETVVDGVYSRSIGLKGLHGSVSIWNGAGDALEVELDFPDPVARLLALHGVLASGRRSTLRCGSCAIWMAFRAGMSG
jgi:hypothetical protein